VEGVLEGDRILPILKRDLVSSHMGPSIGIKTERETEYKEQADGRLHPEKGGLGLNDVRDKPGDGAKRVQALQRSRIYMAVPVCSNGEKMT